MISLRNVTLIITIIIMLPTNFIISQASLSHSSPIELIK